MQTYDERHKFYTGNKWLRRRAMILRRDGYVDQLLKRYGKIRQAEMVHHIFPREEFPELAYEPWNLISLTNETHNTLHMPTTGELSPAGVELLKRTARRVGREIPLRYR